MNDAVHILLAVLLVLVFRRRSLHDLLAAILSVSLPMSDHYLITPLISFGFLSATPIWTHRSITHSLLAFIVVVLVFHYAGYAFSSLLGYSAHIIPDFFFGGVKLFLPFDPTVYGFNLRSGVVESIIGLCFVVIVLYEFTKFSVRRFMV